MNVTLQENWAAWALALAIGFPLVAILLGQLLHFMQRRQWPIAGITRFILNFVLPVAAAFIFVRYVLQTDSTNIGNRITLTLILTMLIYVAQSIFNTVFFGMAQPESWRSHTPRLLRDIILALMVVLGGAIVLSFVWDQNVAGIFTALGIGSVILGFALQETLGNVMLGISLLLERPYTEGDYVAIDGVEGRVTEINWRSTRIMTERQREVIIPHAIAAKVTIQNNSRPFLRGVVTADIGFSYDHPPNLVKKVLLESIDGVGERLHDRDPVVLTEAFGDSAVVYTAAFSVPSPDHVIMARDHFMTLVWYNAQRAGLNIPYPMRTVMNFDGDAVAKQKFAADKSRAYEQMATGPFNAALLDKWFKSAGIAHFADGEAAIKADGVVSQFYVIVAGEAKIMSHGVLLYVLRQGDFFGEEAALSGGNALYDVIASGDLQVLALPLADTRRMLESKPSLVVELGKIMDIRRRAVTMAGYGVGVGQKRV